jgi:hypothetical protein
MDSDPDETTKSKILMEALKINEKIKLKNIRYFLL